MHRRLVESTTFNMIFQLITHLYSFSERLHLISSADVLDEFTVNYNKYLTAVIAEAEDRDRQTVRSSLESYLALRRETGAVTCCFNLLLIPYGIPPHILRDSRITHLETLGLDLVCVGNVCPGLRFSQKRRRVANVHAAAGHPFLQRRACAW